MAFLFPNFLWALLGLSIPIIVHLFFFKRFKKVYFSNTRLLKEIKEETSSRNRLKNLLILLMRCLAIASLVFAFAQPYLPQADDILKGSKHVSIFVDNSFSMNSERDNTPLLEIAKQKARDILKAYNPTDQFQILTQELDGKYQRLISKDDALAMIDLIKPVASVNNLTTILKRQKSVLKAENNISYLISDFQKSITDLDQWKDSSMVVNLLPIQASFQKNVSVDSVWFDAPVPIVNQNNKLVVRLQNHGDEDAEGIKSTITIDGQDRPIGIKTIPAFGSVADTVNLTLNSAGLKQAIISIQDYPVQFDDQYYISFSLPEQIKVLAINDNTTNKYLRAMFNGVSFFKLDDQYLSQIQYQKFVEYDLVVLNDLQNLSSGLSNELGKFIRNGGKVLMFPSANADLSSYNTFLNSLGAAPIISKELKAIDVSTINTQEFIFKDVYELNKSNLKLPTVQQYYLYSNQNTRVRENIMNLRSGASYLEKFIVESGQLYVCSSPLDDKMNNLVVNAEVFVPMLYKMAIARNVSESLGYKIGQNKIIEVDNKGQLSADQVLKMVGETEFIPSQSNLGKTIKLELGNQITKPGYYDIVSGDQKLKNLAFNFNRKESNLQVNTNNDLASQTVANPKFTIFSKDQQEGLASLLKQKDSGIVLWKYFIIAALAFLLLEIILIRFMK
jgi:hypothetical protein